MDSDGVKSQSAAEMIPSGFIFGGPSSNIDQSGVSKKYRSSTVCSLHYSCKVWNYRSTMPCSQLHLQDWYVCGLLVLVISSLKHAQSANITGRARMARNALSLSRTAALILLLLGVPQVVWGALVLFWHKFVDPILSRILWQNTQDWSGRLCGWSSRPKLQEGTTPSSHFVTSNMCNIARLKIPKDLWCVDAFSGHGAVTKVWSHGPWGVVGLRVHVEMVTCKLFAYGAWSEVGITTKRMVLNDYFRSTNFSITHWVKCRCRFDVCDDQAMDLSTASNA